MIQDRNSRDRAPDLRFPVGASPGRGFTALRRGAVRRLTVVCAVLIAVLGTVGGSVAAPARSGVASPDSVVEARLVGPGVGWVLTQHALKRTMNDGRTWTNATPAGLTIRPQADHPGLGVTNVAGWGALDARHAFIATESLNNVDFTMTIWRTADGGLTWRRTTLRHLAHQTGDICGNTCGWAGFRANFYALSPSDAFMDYGYGRGVDEEIHPVFQTSDGGASWHRVGTGNTSLDFRLAFRTTSTILMSDGRLLYSSTSGWDHLTAAPNDDVVSIGVVSTVTFWNARSWIVGLPSYAGGFEFAVTNDAGRSWLYRRRALPKPDPGGSIGAGEIVAFLNPITWLATAATCTTAQVCTGWLVRTGDRGHTWQRLGRLPAGMAHLVFADGLHGWAGLDGPELFATENGGRSWRRLALVP